MNCPKCGAAMQVVQYQEIQVDRCTACGGLWFDLLEHERLRAQAGSEVIDQGDPKAARWQNLKGDIQCPRCHTPMVKMVDRRQPHIWYESCSVCGGAYFDAGEFIDYKTRTIGDIFKDLFAKPRM